MRPPVPRASVDTAAAVLAVAIVALLAGCGTVLQPRAAPVDADQVARVAAQTRQAGQPGYYLGPEAAGESLTHLELVEGNGSGFQVEAGYGVCRSGGDGGCSDPVTVSTNQWHPDVVGLRCQRLAPQLGVPAGEIMGVLTLATGRLTVAVTNRPTGDDEGEDLRRAMSLLPALREVGADQPTGSLPPPHPEVATWMDDLCGTVPGQTVDHPMEGEPAQPLDNQRVPDFTVGRLGGGDFAWADFRGRPLALAVGNPEQVPAAIRRLQAVAAAAPSHPAVAGLVTDLTGDKFNPRSPADIEAEMGSQPVPVGYAAVPMSAVWFLDAASNMGVGSSYDTGVIAFVSASGVVVVYAPADATDAVLEEACRALG